MSPIKNYLIEVAKRKGASDWKRHFKNSKKGILHHPMIVVMSASSGFFLFGDVRNHAISGQQKTCD